MQKASPVGGRKKNFYRNEQPFFCLNPAQKTRYLPFDGDGDRHVDTARVRHRREWVKDPGVEQAEEARLREPVQEVQVQRGDRVHGDGAADEGQVVAGQADQEIIERVLPHLPEDREEGITEIRFLYTSWTPERREVLFCLGQ